MKTQDKKEFFTMEENYSIFLDLLILLKTFYCLGYNLFSKRDINNNAVYRTAATTEAKIILKKNLLGMLKKLHQTLIINI